MSLISISNRFRTAPLSAAAAALALTLPASAQTTPPPDAGQTLRELQRPVPPPQGSATTLQVPAEGSAAADPGQRFAVQAVRIEGATRLPVDELQALVADLVGRQASLGELRQAAQRITRRYRERGFVVARAYLPAQEIRDGTVVIVVLEGTLGATSIDNRSAVSRETLAGVLRAQRLAGRTIEGAATDRALLLMADLPAVGPVSGSLKPGERVGTSDLAVTAEAGRRVEGDVSLDNHGNRYTGQNRLNARVDFNSPSGVGDRLGLRTTLSDEKLLFGRLAYDTPVNSDGLRAGVALSASRYQLGREFAALDASGTARTAGAYGSWPWLRGLNANVWLTGALEYRQLRDEVRSTLTSNEKSTRAATFEAYGDLADSLGAGGYSSWRVTGTIGSLRIATPAAFAADQAGPQAAGRYAKLQAGASRLQGLTDRLLMAVSAAGQLASRNLDSSEKFGLGGAYGVRAYPQGEGIGDEGWLVNVELRGRLTSLLQANLFYDAGGVRFSDRPYAATANRQTLRGHGVGLNADWNAFNLRASIAWRDGTAPVTAPDRSPRFWLTAGWRY